MLDMNLFHLNDTKFLSVNNDFMSFNLDDTIVNSDSNYFKLDGILYG